MGGGGRQAVLLSPHKSKKKPAKGAQPISRCPARSDCEALDSTIWEQILEVMTLTRPNHGQAELQALVGVLR